MLNSWNFEELKKLIIQVYGQSQLNLVEQSIDSLGIRQDFAKYHYQEYETLYDKFPSNLEVNRTYTTEDLEKSYNIEVKIAANILACLQNLHSIHDILGQVIRYAFDLQFTEVNSIYITTVIKNLPQDENLFLLLSELMEHEDYKYLHDFMNQSKHNAVVMPFYQKSFINGFEEVKLPAFKYRGKNYEEKNAKEFLVAVYSRESNLLVKIGQEINKFLANKK